MARRLKSENGQAKMVSTEELVEGIVQETAEEELEKLQKKIAREERKKRKEIIATKQKKAVWLLPALLLVTMMISWVLSQLAFVE